MFYKPQTQQDGSFEFRFFLADLEVQEQYAVWDNAQRRFLKEENDETIQGTDNQQYKIAETKFKKAEDFRRLFPNCNKNTQYIRNIVVPDGNMNLKYQYGFKRMANQELEQAIENSRSFGINPLEVQYKLRKTGSGLATKYRVVSEGKVGLPQNVKEPAVQQPNLPFQQQQQPQQDAMPQQPMQQQNSQNYHPKQTQNPFLAASQQEGSELLQTTTILSDEESKMLEMAEQSPEKLQEQDFINKFMSGMQQIYGKQVDPVRASRIYNEYYNR